MPKVRRPYSRVYWEAVDDPKFSDVWGDDRALSCWLRLLIAADMAWPASASLYHGVHRPSLDKLARVGLVDIQAAGRFRIHGLDKEREQRSEAATDAVRTRYARTTPVDGNRKMSSTEGLPSRDETRRDEQRRDEAERASDDGVEFPVLAWLSTQGVTIPPTGNGFHRRIVVLVTRYGPEKVRDAMAGAMAAGARGDRAIVFGAENLLDPPPSGKAPAKGKGFNPTSDEAWDAFGGRPDVA